MKNILKIVLVLMLLITVGLVVGAAATGGSDMMIGINIIWGYFLVALAVLSAVICAVMGMVSAPAGIKATLLSVGLVVVVVAASYFVAASHTLQIPNIGDGGYFGAEETVITEASVLVTYVAFAGAILVALAGEVMNIVEGLKK